MVIMSLHWFPGTLTGAGQSRLCNHQVYQYRRGVVGAQAQCCGQLPLFRYRPGRFLCSRRCSQTGRRPARASLSDSGPHLLLVRSRPAALACPPASEALRSHRGSGRCSDRGRHCRPGRRYPPPTGMPAGMNGPCARRGLPGFGGEPLTPGRPVRNRHCSLRRSSPAPRRCWAVVHRQ